MSNSVLLPLWEEDERALVFMQKEPERLDIRYLAVAIPHFCDGSICDALLSAHDYVLY